MKLKKVEIKNYRQFSRAELTFDEMGRLAYCGQCQTTCG